MNAWEPNARPAPDGSARVPPIVTVITPTIPGRFELLHEAMESVRRQTLHGVEHAILLDAHGDGPANTRNAMLEMCTTPYVAFLDDDDLLDPDHLIVLLRRLEGSEAGVAYSWPRVVGAHRVDVPRPKRTQETWKLMLAGRNVIPVTVLARTDAIRAGGCFRSEDRYEDYELWMRLHRLGWRFALEPRETWTYRMLGENRTHA